MSYGVDVGRDGKVEIYRVGRGGIEIGGREVVGEEGVEVRVLRIREYYEERAGCEFFAGRDDLLAMERGRLGG